MTKFQFNLYAQRVGHPEDIRQGCRKDLNLPGEQSQQPSGSRSVLLFLAQEVR